MRRTRILPAVMAALAFAACENADSFSGPDGEMGRNQARLTIKLTDAPGDLAEAFIKIDRFILIRDAQAGGEERIELSPLTTDFIELLELSGGKLLNVVDQAVVPPGEYLEVRIVLDDAYVRLKDGRVFATPGAALPSGVTADGELKCPSCAQSGFKVRFTDGGLVVNTSSTVVIDFDAARSFGHEAGKSGKWIMHPVLKATASNIAFGHIAGNVTLAQNITIPACGGQNNTFAVFKPLAVVAADTTAGVTDAQGAFNMSNLLPATYTLGHVAEVTFTNGDSLTIAATPTPASVDVTAGNTAAASYQITAATCH